MEYRKLISFGKSSFIVSLPKSWVVQNKLKKGDLIYFDDDEQNLILSAGEKSKDNKSNEIVLNINGKSLRRIQREIISAYIKDYKTITIIGDDLKSKAEKIQNTIQNLVALEVMEQTSQKIVAKDFLDMENVSIVNLIRKVDIIVRAMIEDIEKMFSEDSYDNIYHRDQDVNRLCFLIFRIVEYGLGNSSFMHKKHGLTSQNLLYLWWLSFNLENAGDEVKRVARWMRIVKLDKKQQERFLKLLAEIKKGYLDVLKGFHTQDVELAHSVLETKDKIIKELDTFYQDNKKIEGVGILIEKAKSLMTCIHNIGRIVYQYSFTAK